MKHRETVKCVVLIVILVLIALVAYIASGQSVLVSILTGLGTIALGILINFIYDKISARIQGKNVKDDEKCTRLEESKEQSAECRAKLGKIVPESQDLFSDEYDIYLSDEIDAISYAILDPDHQIRVVNTLKGRCIVSNNCEIYESDQFFYSMIDTINGLVRYGIFREVKRNTFEITELGIQVRRLFQSDAVERDKNGYKIIGKVMKNGQRIGSVICRGYYAHVNGAISWEHFDNHDTKLIEIEV